MADNSTVNNKTIPAYFGQLSDFLIVISETKTNGPSCKSSGQSFYNIIIW